ncbi:MAG: DUF4340 domain-containing protein [Cytophagales bacterium]|nr:DUF4340 domain-containing protein [Cytophagales bacterium]
MPEKRNLRLLWLLLALSGCLVLVLVVSNRQQVQLPDKNLFQVADLTQINKVIIQPAAGAATELRFDGIKWQVNNAFAADGQMIKILFATLMQTEPRREVALTMRDSISRQLTTTGQQVLLYEGDQLVKQFWVGGNTAKTETYFQTPDGIPYLVQVPGYRLYIASVFELDALAWRDKWLFNFNWQNFRTLTTRFPAKPQNNFTISMQQNYFGIEGLPQADTAKVNSYLDAVSLVQANRFVQPTEIRYLDSLLQAGPEEIITITDLANRNYSLEIYPVTGGNNTCLARLNGEAILVLTQSNRDAITRTRSYFGK